jgi:elongator complex protein 3
MPKSYLISQPAAQRGFRQRFDPYSQTFVRLKALEMEGHEVSKVELRILGGTWSSYPRQYQTWFVKRCLQAMNEYEQLQERDSSPPAERAGAPVGMTKRDRIHTVKKSVKTPRGDSVQIDEVNTLMVKSLATGVSLAESIKTNETAQVRCIGINIETRSDHIDQAEIRRLRMLGVTKVEMGVQTTDNRVQELTRRGHDLQSVKDATRLLKDAGFKIGYHMMPNLPGSTPEMDKKMIGELFTDADYQPDYLKIYPCVVIPRTSLAVQYRRGDFKPYDDETLKEILLQNLRDVPEWCRIDRVARDIPADEIEAGTKISNIRQILEAQLIREGTPCRDIRSREVSGSEFRVEDVKLVRRQYAASVLGYPNEQRLNTLRCEHLSERSEWRSEQSFTIAGNSRGVEHFLSYEDLKQDKLIALLRLRFPGKTFLSELKGAALIREVHVYGKQIAVGDKGSENKQHMGWGTKLMLEAERIAKEAGFKKMAVIAGIGTREYYRKMGYRLEGTYMVKEL